jgi:hypothetical protein
MKKVLKSIMITVLVAIFISSIIVISCLIANVWNIEPIYAVFAFLFSFIIGTASWFALDTAIRD